METQEYTVLVKVGYQVTEDSWREEIKAKKVTGNTTVSEIVNWVASVKGDKNTVKLLPLE